MPAFDIQNRENMSIMENLVCGRSGRTTKAITANLRECMNSSFHMFSLIFSAASLSDIIKVSIMAKMVASFIFHSHTTTQMKYVRNAASSLVIQISFFLKAAYRYADITTMENDAKIHRVNAPLPENAESITTAIAQSMDISA